MLTASEAFCDWHAMKDVRLASIFWIERTSSAFSAYAAARCTHEFAMSFVRALAGNPVLGYFVAPQHGDGSGKRCRVSATVSDATFAGHVSRRTNAEKLPQSVATSRLPSRRRLHRLLSAAGGSVATRCSRVLGSSVRCGKHRQMLWKSGARQQCQYAPQSETESLKCRRHGWTGERS
jgi:hypothetical protein